MLIPSRLIRRSLFSTLAALALTVVGEGVGLAGQSCVVRAATAEEQKFYADAFAQFQRTAPPAPASPAGWTAMDVIPPGSANGVRKEVCAAPGQFVFYVTFERNYTRAGQEVRDRQAEAERRVGAMMQENLAAVKAGKSVDFDAFDAAAQKIMAEAERDTGARFFFRMGGNEPSPVGFSPVTVPVGKGYRQVVNDRGVQTVDLIIVLSPTTAKAGLAVVQIQGDPARVDALLKAASFR